jgi:MFS family permease
MARRSASAHPTLLTPAFLAVTLASLAYFTGDGVLIPAVPRYVQGPLGAGDVAVGLVVGAFSLSAFFLRPWAGGLGDRWGRRPLMLLGAGVFTVSVLGYGTASSPEALAGLRLLTGAGEAFFFVGALTAVADLAPPQRRGEAMSLASLSLYVGIGMGPLLGEVAIERFGFAAAWTLAAAAGLAAVVVALRVPDTRPADHGPEAGEAAAGHRLIHRAGLLVWPRRSDRLRVRRRGARAAQPAADGPDSTRDERRHRPGRHRSRGWSACRTAPRPACCPSPARSATATQRRSWATGRGRP